MRVYDFAAQLERADSIDDLWSKLLTGLQARGINHVIYIMDPGDGSIPQVRTSLDTLYEVHSASEDPFLVHCCNSYGITATGAAFMDDYPYLPARARSFIRQAATEGFQSGLGIPVRLRASSRYGGFNLGTGLDRAIFTKRIWPRREQFRLFCLLVHRRIEELTAPDPGRDFDQRLIAPTLPDAFDELSPREREVFYLLARGLSRKDAARTCDISLNTVAEYAKSAYRKLGIRNRVQAAQLLYRSPPEDRA